MAANQSLTFTIRLNGGRAVVVQNAEVADSFKAAGDAAEVAGGKESFAAEKAFLFGESMYSLRRYAFYGITAIGLTGAELIHLGYSFDEAKAKGVDSLTAIVGGTSQAQQEVSKLVGLTHSSGLGLGVLVGATQNMLGFGFSVKQTNAYLAAFANYAGVKGLGETGVTSLSQLFNTIRGQGFLTNRNVAALTQLGIPGYSLLTQGLHLTPAEAYLLQHGQAQVPASAALPAIAAYLQRYAASQPKGLGQQFAIGKSYLAQILGTIGQPGFNWLDSLAPSLNSFLRRATAGATAGGTAGLLSSIDPSQTLLHGWQALGTAIGVVTGSLGVLWRVASPVLGILVGITGDLLGFAAKSTVVRYALYGLVGGYTALRTAQLAWLAVTAIQTGAMRALGAATLLYEVYVLRAEYATLLLTKAQVLLDAAMDANPIGLIVIGVAALALGFYELYTRVTWFRNGIQWLWHEFSAGSPGVRLALTFAFGPLGLALQTLLLIKDAVLWLDQHYHDLEHFFGIDNSLTPAQLLNQQGSLTQTLGVSRVAKIDQAAGLTVSQLKQHGAPQALVDAFKKALQETTIKGELHTSGRKIGDVAFKAKQAAEARA